MNFSVDSLDGGGTRVPDHPPPGSDEESRLPSRCSDTPLRSCSRQYIPNASELSPWEKWVVRKAKEELTKREPTKKRMAEEREKHKLEKMAALERKRRTEQTYRQWVTAISAQEREKNALELRKMAQKEYEEEKRRQAIEAMSKERFSEWCRRKKEEKEAEKRLHEKQERQEAQARFERRQRSTKAYETWLDQVYHSRSRTAREPSFCNVKPWVGPLQTENCG